MILHPSAAAAVAAMARAHALVALVLLGCTTPRPTSSVHVPPPPPRTSALPAEAREAIATRMWNHKADMTGLLWAVLFVDPVGVAELAEGIVQTRREEPTAALTALLPPDFFLLERESTRQVEAMAQLARAPEPDGVAIARAYGTLTETCVRCHTVFLYGATAMSPIDP